MANTKKTNEKETSVIDVDKLIAEKDEIAKSYAEMQKQMKEMQKMIDKMQESKNSQTVANPNINRTISVYSLLPYTYVLYTQEDSRGTRYMFQNFGEMKRIRYSDLVDIVRIYKNQFADGYAYIADKEFVANECPDIDCSKIFTPKQLEKAILLENNLSLQMILSLSDDMRKNAGMLIAQKMNEGYNYNYNYIKELRDNEIDIEKIAEGLKLTENVDK